MGYLLEKGMNVILAIGAPLPIREKGIEAVMEVCKENLAPGIKHMKEYGASRIVIAYEPVWCASETLLRRVPPRRTPPRP